MVKTILVTGATGHQGGATVTALVDYNSKNVDDQYHILALTRNPTSDSAVALSGLPNVEVVQGELADNQSIAKIFDDQSKNGIYGVFVVLDPFGGDELAQGKLLVDLAISHKVKRIVYSGADLSGLSPTPVPHFETKRQIEEYLISSSSGKNHISWTIFRPGGFLENFYIPGYSLVVAALLNPDIQFPLIGTGDIGRATAEILVSSDEDNEKFKGKKIHLAGSAYPLKGLLEILKKFGFPVEGLTREQAYGGLPEPAKVAFNTYNEFGAEGTPEETKKYFPWVKDLEEWLKTEYQSDKVTKSYGAAK
ncbi:uncharacterized protein IL334_000809 [Kwoniella shivajii]|uniref:NmrA-like domain-containing protein n=1 Tax=Kwoniella shivajii TaxID=564305 RepID=A0ABZ1CQS8_9TREE|nr:hypothetical protein IL334_000809 [Kwoniella shivajii]